MYNTLPFDYFLLPLQRRSFHPCAGCNNEATTERLREPDVPESGKFNTCIGKGTHITTLTFFDLAA
ncbi:MAG: hypothetical protein II453_13595 [Alphaproteobacteria bacterium]|nr:hypothetical protein [Alphaproteobacteria bacterium]